MVTGVDARLREVLLRATPTPVVRGPIGAPAEAEAEATSGGGGDASSNGVTGGWSTSMSDDGVELAVSSVTTSGASTTALTLELLAADAPDLDRK